MTRETDISSNDQEQPKGDLGRSKTWQPPPGEQGISNRSDDEDAVEDDAERRTPPEQS